MFGNKIHMRRGAINLAPTRANQHVCVNINHVVNKNIGGFAKIKNPMINKNSLSNIIRTFKAICSYEVNKHVKFYFKWQRNYHEHIIRNAKEYLIISNYIKNNPKMWDRDRNNTKTPYHPKNFDFLCFLVYSKNIKKPNNYLVYIRRISHE